MYVMANLTSAAGVLSLLSEPEEEVQVFALSRLNELVDDFWAEIAEDITQIEKFSESDGFAERELASLVASKVYYHLGSFDDSLNYALGAGRRFDVSGSSQYIDTIVSKCIDRYTVQRVRQSEGVGLAEGDTISPQLESIVDRMFERCLGDRRYKQAVGIAFETRRIDILHRAIREAEDMVDMLTYCMKVCLSLISSPSARNTVLSVIVRMYEELDTPDYISICQCYIFLDEPHKTAHILEKLARGSKDDVLVAYQIAFDLYENATQHFLRKVQDGIRATLPTPPTATPTDEEETKVHAQETGSDVPAGDVAMETESGAKGELETDRSESAAAPPSAPSSGHVTSHEPEAEWMTRLRAVDTILGGEKTVALHQEFLIRNNHTDLQILKTTKEAGRNSIIHNATIITNGLMHFGTTSDVFLREHLEWLKRASNWAKFTATASLGLIHYGHEKEALHLMSSYLPKDSSGASPYAEGGGLFAIGLIHANHGARIVDYLTQELRVNTNECIRHGGCLGIGLAGMGSANMDVYELLKELLSSDDAVTGEAAGLAMGLVMIGTRSPSAIEDMSNYARETQHEKIQRGLALGLAFVMFGQLEEADSLIEDLCRDKDPLLRRSGVFTIAMAYCGSANNRAIRRLLHIAVSDVDSDVRRAAVMSLGFILFRTPEQCPHVVSLLSESFNPHVRCGAAMALGVACASTGNKEALSLIEPMLNDSIAFVQQAALIASAMILIQHTDTMSTKAAFYRQHYAKVIADKHEDTLTKFGAILSQGIIDAGGRNVSISLQSRAGHMSMRTAVGLLVFSQFWFWFPLCHFLSLALTPTAVITLNSDLKMPKLELRSEAKPSTFAYPAPLQKEKEKEKEKVATVVLSVTAKAKAKEKKKEASSGESMETEAGGKEAASSTEGEKADVMDTEKPREDGGRGQSGGDSDDRVPPPSSSSEEVEEEEEEEGMETAEAAKGSPDASKKLDGGEEVGKVEAKKPEPDFSLLSNPARVLPTQLKVLRWDVNCRYQPLKPISTGGIIILRDTDAEKPEVLIEDLKVPVPGQEDTEEPAPPEPFEWSGGE